MINDVHEICQEKEKIMFCLLVKKNEYLVKKKKRRTRDEILC